MKCEDLCLRKVNRNQRLLDVLMAIRDNGLWETDAVYEIIKSDKTSDPTSHRCRFFCMNELFEDGNGLMCW
jgi:uncharacterized phosphosugar-binding protein